MGSPDSPSKQPLAHSAEQPPTSECWHAHRNALAPALEHICFPSCNFWSDLKSEFSNFLQHLPQQEALWAPMALAAPSTGH